MSAKIDWPTVVATGFGAGYFPVASGTAGSVAMFVVCALVALVRPEFLSADIVTAAAFLTTIIGIVAANSVVDRAVFGEGVEDPKQVVIDEYAGYLVTIIGHGSGLRELFFALLAFRFFDILKPPPVRQLEHLPRGYGIVIDDVMAGVFANVLVHGIRILL